MRSVSANELQKWYSERSVLEEDSRGPKVIALPDGQFLKIFHSRRHPLLARLQPAARRFARNIDRLRQLGIATPEVTQLVWLDRAKGLTGCLYRPLPGEPVEHYYRNQPQQTTALLAPLADFIYRLHRLGVYFRSLHLGNIIMLPDGGFGLIDTLDMQFKRRGLNPWLVKRNFRHLERYLVRHRIAGFPLAELRRLYGQRQP